MRLLRLITLITLCLAGCLAQAGDTLRVLAWPGYADPDMVTAFEQKTGAKVEVTFIDTDDALWKKASANEGRDFDVLAVNVAELHRLVDAGVVREIPPGSIPNAEQQLPRFHNAVGTMRGAQRFAVPFTYSEMGLIYDKHKFKQPPTSMAALWDQRYQGRIALYEGSSHNFSITALVMGAKNPFSLDANQFREAVARLIRLRANRPLFYSSPEDAVALFGRHDVALMFGNYGSQQIQMLNKAGYDVGYVIPQEGALAWLDCWAMLRGSGHTQLATAWINYMSSPEIGHLLTQRQGLANTFEPSPILREQDKLYWLQPVEDSVKRNQYWTRILSGAKQGMF